MIGEAAAVGTAMVWAIASLLMKPLSTRFNPLVLNNIRCLAAALSLAPFLLATGKFALLSQIPLSSAFIAIAGTFISIGLGESLFVLSLRYIDISRSFAISICGYPLVTIGIALIFLQEKITGLSLLGMTLVLSGLFLVAFPAKIPSLSFYSKDSRQKIGMSLILLSTIASGVGTVVIKLGTQDLDLLSANFLRLSGFALALVPFSFVQGARHREKKSSWHNLGLAGLSGALNFGLGGTLFLLALQRSGAAMASVLSSVSPLFMLPMAVLFFKERVTRKLIAGVVLSVLGIAVVFLPPLLS